MKYITVPTLLFLLLTFTASCSLFGGGDSNLPDIPGKIVFAADDDNGSSQIFAMNANGSDVRQLTHLEDGQEAYQPSWSPDGSQIVFSTSLRSSSNGFSLYLMNADGSNMRALHERENSHIPLPGNNPRWSPDGTKIVYDFCVNCQLGTNLELFIYNFGTDAVIRLTDNKVSDSNPTWSPDGQRIAFTTDRDYPDGPGVDVYIIDSMGNNIIRLTQTGNAGRPFWFSNGENLGYWSENNLYKLNLQSMNSSIIPIELGNRDLGFRPFQIASDGEYIFLHVFNLATPREEESLNVLNLDENKLVEIYRNTGLNGADWFIPKNN